MVSTHEWALLHNESVDATPPSWEGHTHHYPRTAREVAVRAMALQGVVAAAYGVEREMIIEWLQEEKIWEAVTAQEKEFLLAPMSTEYEYRRFQCHQEAEWTLLWMLGKVEALGLPTHYCDSRRLVEEIVPGFATDLDPFLDSAELRDTTLLLAEDFRTYNLWCQVHQDRRLKQSLPHDLNLTVLYERRYAFEWLDSVDDWDKVTCDA